MGRLAATIWLGIGVAAQATLPARAHEPVLRLARPHAVSPVSLEHTEQTPDRRAHRNPADSCRRWKTIAGKLGETYAGQRLRETVVARACALSGYETHDDEAWQWPWRDGTIRAELPPRLHGSIGEWVIRCGKAGRRQRCAMLHEAAVRQGAPGSAPPRIISHFVIDTIAGRESVIWRVLVTGSERQRDRIELSLEAGRISKGFLACGKPGCLMEADVRLSTAAANVLWDGKPLELVVTRDGRVETLVTLPGLGFSAALRELARLRGEETRAQVLRR